MTTRTLHPSDQPENSMDQTRLVRGTLIGSLAKDLILGNFIVAYAVQVLDLSEAEITWFLSVIPLSILLRYPFLDRIRQHPRIQVTIAARWLQLICLTLLLVLPAEWVSLPVLFAIAILFVFANEFFQNAVWINLVAEVSTERDRGRFLGRLRMWKQGTNMSFALFGFFLVGHQLSRGEYQILLLVVIGLLINSLFWYGRVTRHPPPPAVKDFSGKGQFWDILRNHPMMRRPLMMTFVVSVLQWPILIVYLVGTLHMPANVLMLTIVASMSGSIVSEVIWGKAADRYGIKRIFQVYFVGSIALLPILLLIPDFAMVEAGTGQWQIGIIILLIFYFLRGTLEAGQLMAISMYRAHFVNGTGGFHAHNLLTAANQVFLSGLSAIGGYILVASETTGSTPWLSLGFVSLWIDPFRVTSVIILLVAMIVGLLVCKNIRLSDQRVGS